MSLAHRIIPSLLCRGRELVKGKQFNSWRSVGIAAQAVRIHQARGVDELLLLDISATPENRGPDIELIKDLSEVCFMPLSIGGGIWDMTQVDELMYAGADKVVIGSALYVDPYLGVKISEAYGSQVLVASIDVRNGVVWTHCGKEKHKVKPESYAVTLEGLGVGEILLTSIDREGMMEGYDLKLIESVANRVNIPVIAHGGCGTYEHMAEAIKAGAHAVSAGSLFQFTDATPRGAAEYLYNAGIEVRCKVTDSNQGNACENLEGQAKRVR